MEIVRKEFKDPPSEFSPVPFWFLNSEISDEEIEWNLNEFTDKHIFNVVMHPRTGMKCEYLSEAFWDRMKSVIEKCAAKNIRVFLYDEYNWPSGVLGGKLLREHPEFKNVGLIYRIFNTKGESRFKIELSNQILIAKAVEVKTEKVLDLKNFIKENTIEWVAESGRWKIIVFFERYFEGTLFCTVGAPWCKGESGYIDVLNPKAVEYFIKNTHEEYKKRFGNYFGNTIIGIFTDEPSNYMGLMWTRDFLKIFENQKGYRLEDKIQELAVPIGDYIKTRCDYNEVATQLYETAYYKQISDWCLANNIVLTGHLNMEENLNHLPKLHGSLYRAYKPMQLPGIDLLADRPGYEKVTTLTICPELSNPNFLAKYISSIAHITGAKRILCEIFGGVGWKTNFERMKSTIDWIEACGVNLINWHGAHMSLEGCRKRDFPISHFVQEPYWDQYQTFSDYVSRLSLMNQGIHIADIAIFFPISTFWAEFSLLYRPKYWQTMFKTFNRIVEGLLKMQRDFDILFEEAFVNDEIVVNGSELQANQEKFKILILPPLTTIAVKVIERIESFYLGGGMIVSIGKLPTNSRELKNDPQIINIVNNIFGGSWENNDKELIRENSKGGKAIYIPLKEISNQKKLYNLLESTLEELYPFDLKLISPKRRNVIYNHRKLPDGESYFIANLSKERFEGEIQIRNQGKIEKWDPIRGQAG
ncbi:MAG TPA: glycosyl hydrolase, partial [Candidatus Deferrimicrobium sp.]|nr:glycosyl hydrolase [Candidatus Deferrimicrobium sp.]